MTAAFNKQYKCTTFQIYVIVCYRISHQCQSLALISKRRNRDSGNDTHTRFRTSSLIAIRLQVMFSDFVLNERNKKITQWSVYLDFHSRRSVSKWRAYQNLLMSESSRVLIFRFFVASSKFRKIYLQLFTAISACNICKYSNVLHVGTYNSFLKSGKIHVPVFWSRYW